MRCLCDVKCKRGQRDRMCVGKIMGCGEEKREGMLCGKTGVSKKRGCVSKKRGFMETKKKYVKVCEGKR